MAIKFSIPNVPSLSSTTRSTNGMIFVPDVKHLVGFLDGDLSNIIQGTTGFADIMAKTAISKSLNMCDSEEVFDIYKNVTGISLPLESTNYFKSGKFKVPLDDITLSLGSDYSGMKALEKSIIQSLLETQKPYMEIFKGVAQSMIKIEDIVACVLAVGGRSLKPVNNPRALGYKKNKSILINGLANMDKVSSILPSDIYTKVNPSVTTVSSDESRDIKYSTGQYDPSVDYEYRYEYYNESKLVINDTIVEDDVVETKPPVIVFGIYNSKGNELNMDQIPSWLLKSGKFFGQFDQQTDYKYKWIRGSKSIYSHDQPMGMRWKKETYKVDTDINGFTMIKGDPILYFDKGMSSDHELYKKYFHDEIKSELSRIDLTEYDKTKAINNVEQQLLTVTSGSDMIQQLLSMMVTYNYLNQYDGVKIPLKRAAYKAKKIDYNGNGIWVDPESDYDLKIIKIDTKSSIKHWDKISKSEVVSEVLFFDRRSIDIYVSDSMAAPSKSNEMNPTAPVTDTTTFSAIVYNNGVIYNNYSDVTMISIPDPNESDNFTIDISKIGKGQSMHKFTLNHKPGPSERIGVTFTRSGKGIGPGEYEMVIKRVSGVSNKVMVRNFGKTDAKLVELSLINNDYLSKSTKYSSGEYGQDSQCTMEALTRSMQYSGDTETYYMVEGVLSSLNDTFSVDIFGNGGASGRGYYKIKDVVKAVRKFISLLIHLAVRIFPPITKSLEIFSNPSKLPAFVVDIIKAKIGDDFGTGGTKFETYSSKFQKEVSSTLSYANMIKSDATKDIEYKKTQIEEHIKKTKLKNYFYVDKNLDVKSLIDGESITELFNIKFGIKVANMIPKLKLYKSTKNGTSVMNVAGSSAMSPEDIELFRIDSALYKNLSSFTSINSLTDISVVYSTGSYIEGINYNYTYVSEKISEIITRAEALEHEGDLISALKLYSQYIALDPDDQVIQNKYKSAFERAGKDYLYEMALNNPLFDLMLGMVTSPIKVAKSMIDYLLNFFKGLTNPFTLPKKITEFVSFKWVLDLLSKDGIMKALGMKINISGLKQLLNSVGDIDISGIIIIPFLSSLPKFNADQFKDININSLTGGLRSVLTIIENIFNMFIDLIWAIMGLAPLLKKRPYLNLSGDITPDISGDITDYIVNMILGEEANSFIRGDVSSTTILRSFVYDVKLPDGRMIKDLDRTELDKWISDNENLNIELNF